MASEVVKDSGDFSNNTTLSAEGDHGFIQSLVVGTSTLSQKAFGGCNPLNIFCLIRLVFDAIVAYLLTTVEHLVAIIVVYLVICLLLYVSVVQARWLDFRRHIKDVHRVLFVIAHPDDECMFFGPTLLHFIQEKDCLVYIMCLSTGRNYGMGMTRKAELFASCRVLGLDLSNVVVLCHTLMPDTMDVPWPEELVARQVLGMVQQYDIDAIITFDKHGVSRHVNHCSIYFGVAQLVLEQKLPENCRVFVLETVNVIRKYWYTFDLPVSYILSSYRYILQRPHTRKPLLAMRQHKSQLMWFRRLYVIFSRYMIINTLQQMTLGAAQLELDIDDWDD